MNSPNHTISTALTIIAWLMPMIPQPLLGNFTKFKDRTPIATCAVIIKVGAAVLRIL